jgi:hypothetical protein
MKKLLLTSIAALLLATGTASAEETIGEKLARLRLADDVEYCSVHHKEFRAGYDMCMQARSTEGCGSVHARHYNGCMRIWRKLVESPYK